MHEYIIHKKNKRNETIAVLRSKHTPLLLSFMTHMAFETPKGINIIWIIVLRHYRPYLGVWRWHDNWYWTFENSIQICWAIIWFKHVCAKQYPCNRTHPVAKSIPKLSDFRRLTFVSSRPTNFTLMPCLSVCQIIRYRFPSPRSFILVQVLVKPQSKHLIT